MSGNLVHDFPRLAKESGFYFHFRNRKVEWEEIANLNVEDIANNRHFQLLEDKLPLIINCDLGDYVTHVLDRDFVKLFRLAQLAVGYLRHCQKHLDRCVVSLEEKLAAALKECESLKADNNDEKYKCESCDKIFLTTNYLDSHQKRRHGKYSTTHASSQTDDVTPLTPVLLSRGQQTEDLRVTYQYVQTDAIMTQNVACSTQHDADTEKELNKKLAEFNSRIYAVESMAEELKAETKSTQKIEPKETLELSQLVQPVAPTPDFSVLIQQLLPVIQKELQTTKVIDKQHQEELLINFETPVKQTMPRTSELEAESTESSSRDSVPKKQTKTRIRKKFFVYEDLKPDNEQPKIPPVAGSITSDEEQIQTTDKKSPVGEETQIKKLAYEATRKAHMWKDINKTKKGWENLQEDVIVPYRRDEKEIEDEATEKPYKYGKMGKDHTYERFSSRFSSDNKQEDDEHNKETKKPKSFLKNLLKKSSPNLKGIKTSLKKSWSNLYDKRKDDNGLLKRSLSEDVLDSGDKMDKTGGIEERTLHNTLAALKNHQEAKRQLNVTGGEAGNQDMGGISEDIIKKTVAALRNHQQLKTGIRTRQETLDEEETVRMGDTKDTDWTKMYDVSSESGSDYSAKIVALPTARVNTATKINQENLLRQPEVFQEPKITSKNVEDKPTKDSINDMIESFLETSKINENSSKLELELATKPSMGKNGKKTKPSRESSMYDFDSSSIESIPTSTPNPNVRKNENTKNDVIKEGALISPLSSIKETPKITTDLSIFQVTPKVVEAVSSDSESDLPKNTEVRLKSSLASKSGGENTVKRVVFADNFALDINTDLLNVPKEDDSDLSNWDEM